MCREFLHRPETRDLYKELCETKTKKGEFFKYITELQAGLDYEGYIDCDFLAAAAALHPECIKTTEKRYLLVEDSGKYSRGLTILQNDSTSNYLSKTKVHIVIAMEDGILCELRRKMLRNVQC